MRQMNEETIKLLQRNELSNMVYNARFTIDDISFSISDIFYLFKDAETIEDFGKVISSDEFKDIYETMTYSGYKVFCEVPSLRVTVFLVERLVKMVYSNKIDSTVLKRYRDCMVEVLLLTTIGHGILIPESTRTLKSILKAWTFLLNYDSYHYEPYDPKNQKTDFDEMYYYRVDLTRMIDELLPDDIGDNKYDRAMFNYLLRIPH